MFDVRQAKLICSMVDKLCYLISKNLIKNTHLYFVLTILNQAEHVDKSFSQKFVSQKIL